MEAYNSFLAIKIVTNILSILGLYFFGEIQVDNTF
jgi:hypothetical protein